MSASRWASRRAKATSKARSPKALTRASCSPARRAPKDSFGVIKTRKRGVVRARNAAQDRYLAALRKHELVFAEGPAGTGKTWLAVGHAVSLLEQGSSSGLILSRPAVEAGERLGFLPGDMTREGRPVPAADLRRALRFHGRAHGRARHPDGHDRDRAARLHARPHLVEGRGAARRGAERDRDADEDVPHPPRRRLADDGQRRSDPDRSRARAEVRTRRSDRGCCRSIPESAMCASATAMSCATIWCARSSKPMSAPDMRDSRPRPNEADVRDQRSPSPLWRDLPRARRIARETIAACVDEIGDRPARRAPSVSLRLADDASVRDTQRPLARHRQADQRAFLSRADAEPIATRRCSATSRSPMKRLAREAAKRRASRLPTIIAISWRMASCICIGYDHRTDEEAERMEALETTHSGAARRRRPLRAGGVVEG